MTLRISILLTALIALPGCTPSPQPPLVLASNDWMGYRPLYLAQELGYIDRSAVHLLELTSTSEVLRKFRNGVIHAAALTLDEALVLKQDGLDIKIVMVIDVSQGGDAIIAKQSIASLEDLRGKTIGVEKSAVGAYLLGRALESANLSPQDVTNVSLEFGEHENAFLSGKVDAIVTFEPVRSQLLKKAAVHGAHVIFDSSQIPGEIVDVFVVRSDYLQQHSDTIRSIVTAWFSALTYMQSEPDAAAEFLSSLSGLSLKEYAKAATGMRFAGYQENLQLFSDRDRGLHATVQSLQTLMYRQNLLAQKVAVETILHNQVLEQIRP